MRKKLVFLGCILLLICVSHISIAQRVDRGIKLKDTSAFIPKGNLLFGGTISYHDYKSYDYKFLVMDNLNLSGYSFKVSPYLLYFFADNMAAGVKFAYKRSLIKLDDVSINLSEELGLDLSDFYSLGHTYYGSLSYRNYIPLGNSKRFALFSDINLDFGAGQSKIVNGKGESLSGTFQETFEVGIGVVPGLVAFVTNEVAVEASVGIMGLKYKRVKQLTNQVLEGSYETSSADFKIDLFSINIGVSFFIPIVKSNKTKKK